jgi:ParB-like chromosome segregation protein Spo0J
LGFFITSAIKPKDIKKLEIVMVKADLLKPSDYNPRKWSEEAISQLTESIKRFGLVDPVICNIAPGRENVVIGGYFRLKIAKDLGYTEMPVVYVNIPDLEREKELNLRLNKKQG